MMQHNLSYERRRYGNTTYTWIYVEYNGEWLSLGDPWPCVNPKQSEVNAAIQATIKEGE